MPGKRSGASNAALKARIAALERSLKQQARHMAWLRGRQYISKSILWASPAGPLAVDDWLSDQAVRVPADGSHGPWSPGTLYVRVGVAGTGTNTIILATSSSLAGSRTTRATVNLGTAREASAAVTWTPEAGQYMWVQMTAVGGTEPQNGVAQFDLLEAAFGL